MTRAIALVAVFAAVTLFAAKSGSATSAIQPDRIWFSPAPGSIDYVDLFSRPQDWPRARALTTVFKFIQQHTQMPPAGIVGPNSYEALASAGVFRTLKTWGVKTAIEVGAVKEFYCTPDASGMNAAIANTLDSIRAVQKAGGTVAYLAMDDPFAAGRAAVCGGPAPEPTADRIATYVAGVHAVFPSVRIGMIEAYPLTGEAALESILGLLSARGVTPAFLHMDVDSRALGLFKADFTQDMRALRQACAARRIPFGIILWGYNGDSDVLYALDVERVVSEITTAFPAWDDMPDHFILQSWAQSSTGLDITPSNLPEVNPYTHTYLLWNIYRRLRGQTGASTNVAVSRR
jgi:hypothetical protein